ncbi:MAG: hypothetical protein IKN55_01780, partial [Oscillospiraceae bacterium]|nr:hypothetical protein [Oscillospiraceae bacterium]
VSFWIFMYLLYHFFHCLSNHLIAELIKEVLNNGKGHDDIIRSGSAFRLSQILARDALCSQLQTMMLKLHSENYAGRQLIRSNRCRQ